MENRLRDDLYCQRQTHTQPEEAAAVSMPQVPNRFGQTIDSNLSLDRTVESRNKVCEIRMCFGASYSDIYCHCYFEYYHTF